MKTRSFIYGLFLLLVGCTGISAAITKIINSTVAWLDVIMIIAALFIIMRGSMRIYKVI